MCATEPKVPSVTSIKSMITQPIPIQSTESTEGKGHEEQTDQEATETTYGSQPGQITQRGRSDKEQGSRKARKRMSEHTQCTSFTDLMPTGLPTKLLEAAA